MKKIFLGLCMAMLVFATTGCKKDRMIETTNMETCYYTVKPNMWLAAPNNEYMYASFENSAITPNVIENGCVVAFLVDADNRDNPLPYEMFLEDQGNFYSETFSYDVSFENGTGMITFKFAASDQQNSVGIANYGDMSFKVCVFESVMQMLKAMKQ
ncbi:MAG: hypothetical protein K5867_10845 [Bacteroidales bacterium]|jgi:hypothetical protein|nr:hypothetical protein [Bacteroidales bacterium]